VSKKLNQPRDAKGGLGYSAAMNPPATREVTQEGDAAVDLLASVFEERAEYLSPEELTAWTTTTSRDVEILSKLKGPGAKLLTGPRGSGKSTLLRKAYFELLDGGEVMTAYVNYARSLALEPLFHRRADALALFRQWALMKIVVGLSDSLRERGKALPDTLVGLEERGRVFIRQLETGQEPETLEVVLAPSELLLLLEAWTKELRLRRCVLLLDDAAHAFSPEQQREFFEIFRELRSRVVSAKAAVYPGITAYSPHFHVGHEAELIEAWYRPDDAEFLQTMRSMVDRRLPPALLKKLEGREELVDYLALAAFGLPRGFLVMLSQLLGVEEDDSGQAITRRGADRAVATHADSVTAIFRALAVKLPRMKNFVEVGVELEGGMTRVLSSYNRTKGASQKAVVVGILDPLGPELTRVLAMLEYAGIVRRLDTVSRGAKGVFHRYVVHYALVLRDNALSMGRSVAVAAAVDALINRNAHAFVRARGTTLLGGGFEERCRLDLAPCQNCGAPRLSEDAKFCARCGRELKDVSVYDELLHAPIERLPLTQKKLEGLLRHTSIRTVQDVLVDDEYKEIRSVPYVGAVWAARIRRYADEFVSV
jgi:hypothetical protein